ncbi:MAG: hypothetical protein M1835_001962 [Candelina submexicana]|nr:MAG: hypothetical protein M1835_001962 [Candelina submexicana]
MSETNPLLPRAEDLPPEPSIFLRVCHSPWVFISDRTLAITRGLIACYLTAIFAADVDFEVVDAKRGKLFFFMMGTGSLFIQVVYYWISFFWTYQNYWDPQSKGSDVQEGHNIIHPSNIWAAIRRVFRMPQTEGRNAVLFTIFYSAAVTIPFVVTIVFWLIMIPSKPFSKPDRSSVRWFHKSSPDDRPPVEGGIEDHPFSRGFFKAFMFINLHVINSFIALAEIFFLNSVKKQSPSWIHIVGLIVLDLLYVAWLYIGRVITGVYVYKFIDPSYKGTKPVVVSIISVTSFTVTMFSIVSAFHGLREIATARGEKKRQRYGAA